MLTRLAAWLSRVPPLWWARFVYVAMICAILLAAASAVFVQQAKDEMRKARASSTGSTPRSTCWTRSAWCRSTRATS